MPRVDVLLLAVANLQRDARTINLDAALRSSGLTTHCVGIPNDWEPLRAITKWTRFRRHVATLDVVPSVVIGMDLFAMSAARAIARKCAVPLMYDAREFYFALGPLEGRGLKQRIIAAHERSMVSSASGVMVSGELDAEIIQERFALKKKPFVLLNTPPYRERVPSDLRVRIAVESPEVTVALYQGVVHHGRGIGPFLRAMPMMPNVHLVVVGQGPATLELRALAESLGVHTRVSWLGAVPYDQLHALTCGADVGLCLIEPLSKSYEYALPNKMFEYMMARIPTMASNLPALGRLLQEHEVGVLVEPSLSASAIVSAMAQCVSPNVRTRYVDACEGIRSMSYETQARDAVAFVRGFLP